MIVAKWLTHSPEFDRIYTFAKTRDRRHESMLAVWIEPACYDEMIPLRYVCLIWNRTDRFQFFVSSLCISLVHEKKQVQFINLAGYLKIICVKIDIWRAMNRKWTVDIISQGDSDRFFNGKYLI